MERPIRKPLQGLLNVISFNWHHFVFAVAIIFLFYLLATSGFISSHLAIAFISLVAITIVVSLVATWWIFDYTNLYELSWLPIVQEEQNLTIVNIHAGFDETSQILQHRYSSSKLVVFDFYDPALHTEISIKRARKKYPPFPGTIAINTSSIPFPSNAADIIVCMFSAHEIRNNAERVAFFNELKRILKKGGSIYLTEHLRDLPNFLVYSFGAFHFLALPAWLQTIESSGLQIKKIIRVNPFVKTFIIQH